MTTSGAGLTETFAGSRSTLARLEEALWEVTEDTFPHGYIRALRANLDSIEAAHASLVAAVNELLAAEDFMLHMPLNSLVDGHDWGHEARWNAALDAVRAAATDRSAGHAD